MSDKQPHIKCKKGDVHKWAIVPGDPARVLKIAEYVDDAKEVIHNREYLGYNGNYGGVGVTIMSTGMGCPSTLIGLEELSHVGAEKFIRLGTCGGLKPGVNPGDLIIPTSAIKPDGELLGEDIRETPVEADKEITNALISAAEKLGVKYHTGVNRTHDSFYESLDEFLRLKGKNLISSEMECASVFLFGKLKNLGAGCVLVVNTYEPPEEVEKNPEMIYELSDKDAISRGMDNAIRVVLEAIKSLEA